LANPAGHPNDGTSRAGLLDPCATEVDDLLAICTAGIRVAEQILVRNLDDMTRLPGPARRYLESASVRIMEELAHQRRRRARLQYRRQQLGRA
jgi:hypothetical protein